MKRWTRMLRAAIGMGATWAIAWVVAGLAIGVSSVLVPSLPWSAFFEIFDAPLPALALPGFIGGALFSVVVGVAGRRRRFDQLSLPAFTAWGALGGVLLALVPQTMATLGLATISSRYATRWQLTAIIIGPIVLLSAASACATLLVARRASRRDVTAGDSAASVSLGAEGDSHALPTGHGLDEIRRALRDAPPAIADARARQPSETSAR